MSEGDVAIGFCLGEPRSAFLLSIIAFMGADRERRRVGAVLPVAGPYIDDNRNRVVLDFLEGNRSGRFRCTWLWFLDVDIGFAPDTLERLLAATENGARKIVAANYVNQLDTTVGPTLLVDPSSPPVPEGPEGAAKVTACGMGCTLIHRQVLEDVFEQQRTVSPDEQDLGVWFTRSLGRYDGEVRRMGEDISFCFRARQAGHEIWGLDELVVDHYKIRRLERDERSAHIRS